MAKIAVVFDTNSCRTERTSQAFFGQKPLMIEMSQFATVIIPQLVIDELAQQKVEGTRENIKKLRENPLLPAVGFDFTKLDEIIEHDHVKQLYELEDLNYEVIDISEPEKAYTRIRELVIPGHPPFNKRTEDGKNNSDKGVKDAIIACTVDELLSSGLYDQHYLACRDGRLIDYFAESTQIKCMTPEAILEELKKEFFDEYTLGVIRQELGQPSATLKDDWLNLNSDMVANIEYEEYETLVVFDAKSKEIIKYVDALYVPDTDKLSASNSFIATHEVVTDIFENIDFYSEEQLAQIKNALLTNDQVFGIGTDEDVKTLALPIFNFFKEQLSDEEKKSFDIYYDMKDTT